MALDSDKMRPGFHSLCINIKLTALLTAMRGRGIKEVNLKRGAGFKSTDGHWDIANIFGEDTGIFIPSLGRNCTLFCAAVWNCHGPGQMILS